VQQCSSVHRSGGGYDDDDDDVDFILSFMIVYVCSSSFFTSTIIIVVAEWIHFLLVLYRSVDDGMASVDMIMKKKMKERQ